MQESLLENHSFRILVLDDEDQYLDIFRLALGDNPKFAQACLSNASNDNAEGTVTDGITKSFDITYSNNSQDAVFQIKQSIADQKPFSLAFLDIRLESSPDGVWAAEQIRVMDPNIEIVMVTGYADYSPQEIVNRVPPLGKIIYITKPFGINQIIHFSHALVRKWLNEQDFRKLTMTLEKTVQERTRELEKKNLHLQEEIDKRIDAEDALKKAAGELDRKVRERTADIEGKTIALEVLLNKREEDKVKLGETVVSNAKILLMPIIEKIKGVSSTSTLQSLVNILELNLKEIISPFIGKLSSEFYSLTYMETQVAHYVKIGRSNKEIAETFGVSIGTILSHRHSLRKKLGITNKKVNLRTHILSLE